MAKIGLNTLRKQLNSDTSRNYFKRSQDDFFKITERNCFKVNGKYFMIEKNEKFKSAEYTLKKVCDGRFNTLTRTNEKSIAMEKMIKESKI